MEKWFQNKSFSTEKREQGIKARKGHRDMNIRKMHRALGILLAAALIFQTMPFDGTAVFASESSGSGLCEHHRSHTLDCGYKEAEPGHECTHEHTEDCYKTVEKEDGSTTKELDCCHVHDESCGCREAVEGSSCTFVCEICKGRTDETPEENTDQQEDTGICKHHQEHDDTCGCLPESEGSEGSPCAYECRICPVEELIAALPDAADIMEDNADEVRAQLEEILKIYRELNEDEQGQIDLSRCYALQGALDVANDPMPLATDNVVLTAADEVILFTVEECGDNCQGHIITQNIQGGVVMGAEILVESGTHDVTFSGLTLTTAAVGIMPGGTMNLTLVGTNKIKGSDCGFYVPVGANLVITEQSTGLLDISLSSSTTAAGIGGAYYDPYGKNGDFNCGTVIINGGTITAAGRDYSAGIGGASYAPDFGNGGNITITGGHVTATGSNGAPGIGGGYKAGSDGSLTISSADVLAADTVLGSKGKYTINGVPTADMISVPADIHYTSADMAAEIADKVTLSGGMEVCGKTFQIDTAGWELTVTKKSDLEYTAFYTHADKGTISKPVIILPCIHNNGAALTRHDRVEADCMHTGVMEYWGCSICGKNFSDKDGQTEITDMEIPIAAHSLTHHEKAEADCTHTGVMEYWDCSVCGKKFSDNAGQAEITDTKIPIAAHTLTHHERNEANCTQAGNVEYWDCSVCGKKFSDEDGQMEISDADTVIPVKSHTLTHYAEVKADCLADGSIEYWSCSVCSKLFSDADGKTEVTDIKTPAKGHDYGVWESNGNGTHTHSCQTSGCGFTETKDCSGGTASYTEKSICTACGKPYGELLKDAGAPTGEISIRTNRWNSFLNTITFGLFFKDTEQITIIAEDKESGVASVSYHISETELSEGEVKNLDSWTDGNAGQTTFSIGKDASVVVYARITDIQGNVTYISSDGLVFDGMSPVITGVTDGKTYCTPQTVTVTDYNLTSVTVNGNEVILSDGKFALSAKSGTGTMTIEAADKAGNTASVTVTVNNGHSYSTDWKSDGNIHWHECSCGDKADTAAHTEGGGIVTKPATETETGIRTYKCSVCGYVIRTEDIEKLPSSAGGGNENSGGSGENGGTESDNGNNGGQGSGGNDNTTPDNGNNTPQIPMIPPAENTNPGNEAAPGTGTTPASPGNGNTTRPGTGSGSVTGTPEEGTKQPFIKGEDGKIGWDVIRAEEEKAEDGSSINVDMNGSVAVPGDIFDRLKGKDITITFDMGNGILWSVDGKSITTDKTGDIDFSVKTGVNTVPVDIVNNVTGESCSIQISLAYEGELGFTAVLSIELGKENAWLTASLYYYNESTGELEFVCKDQVAEDGTASLAFTHASDYVIAIDGEREEGDGTAESLQPGNANRTVGNGTA